METKDPLTFQARTRQLFRLRSFLRTLHKGILTMDTTFKIVASSGPDDDALITVAIFYYDNYAIQVTPNMDDAPSSIVVYPLNPNGIVISSAPIAFGPFSATLNNLLAAREYIDHLNAEILDDDTKLLPLPAFKTPTDLDAKGELKVPAFLKKQAD